LTSIFHDPLRTLKFNILVDCAATVGPRPRSNMTTAGKPPSAFPEAVDQLLRPGASAQQVLDVDTPPLAVIPHSRLCQPHQGASPRPAVRSQGPSLGSMDVWYSRGWIDRSGQARSG
jgi:hypothetical protein